jgi:hypothetical protein
MGCRYDPHIRLLVFKRSRVAGFFLLGHLQTLNILGVGSLKLKVDDSRVDAMRRVGSTEHWSSLGLYHRKALFRTS